MFKHTIVVFLMLFSLKGNASSVCDQVFDDAASLSLSGELEKILERELTSQELRFISKWEYKGFTLNGLIDLSRHRDLYTYSAKDYVEVLLLELDKKLPLTFHQKLIFFVKELKGLGHIDDNLMDRLKATWPSAGLL